jgi:hypothetical protein
MIPAVFIIFTVSLAALSASRNPRELIAFAVTIVVGSAIYYLARRTKYFPDIP